MINQRKQSRRSSDSRIALIKAKHEGLILMMPGTAIGAYCIIGIQQIIAWFNPELNGDQVQSKSFIFIVFASIIFGAMIGRAPQFMRDGYYRFCGAMLGLSIGYTGFLVLAKFLYNSEIYNFGLWTITIISGVILVLTISDNDIPEEANKRFVQ